jgi:chloramphenicol-sensitive protein RarD
VRGPVDTQGLWLGVVAYLLWGLSPLYWDLLDHVAVLEVLANRVVWSVPLLAVVVALRGRVPQLRAAAANRSTVTIAVVAATMLSINWGIFIWGVTTDHVVEVSLGYFINPLLSVALGVAVLRERLSRAQGTAVALAAIGVAYMTVRMGEAPWISLILAASFALYGLLKKNPRAAPALEGLLLETTVLLVPAFLWIGIGIGVGGGEFGSGVATTLLLIGAGAVTVMPLLAFGASAKRIPLSVLGLLQYLAPTLQFLLGVLVYGETVGTDQLIGFALVWMGLIVLSVEGVVVRRQRSVTASVE